MYFSNIQPNSIPDKLFTSSKTLFLTYPTKNSMRTPMLPLFLDQLGNERKAVFHKLAAFADKFVLAGGTAIMLQLDHRRSFDFDCFSQQELSANLLAKTRRIFGPGVHLKTKTEDILTITTLEGVEVTFVSYPYPPLRPPLRTAPFPLFHLDDLVTNKAFTLGRRPVWRDYVDLFFFLKWNLYPIDKIIRLAEKKYGGEFNGKLFLQQLTYFDDVDIIKTEFLKEEYTAEEIRAFLETAVRNYLDSVL